MANLDVTKAFAIAERCADAGRWAEAREEYLRVLAMCPTHADAMLQLSYADSIAGDYPAARDWALRAVDAELPKRAEAQVELIRRLRTFCEAGALRDCARRMLAAQQTPPQVLLEAARQLSILNVYDVALECAEFALTKAPANPHARLVRGQLLANYGQADAAEHDFVQVLERHPNIAMGWWLLARLRTQTLQSNHVDQIRHLLQKPGLSIADRAVLARALHKEQDDLGNYDQAWQALEVMCRARRGSLNYDVRSTRALFDALVAWPSGNYETASAVISDKVPVFIVGMHRSGTTLLEQLLDASPQVCGLGELNDFAAAMRLATGHGARDVVDLSIIKRASGVDFAAVGRRYLDGMAWRLGDARFFTDKQPSNFLNTGFICRALPHAKILHLVRDPMQTCFSNLRELYTGVNPFSYDQTELAEYFIQYRRLMTHWHRAFPGRVLDVEYAKLISDTPAEMRRVAAFCGLDYVDAMRDPRSSKRAVSTASAVQVRAGIQQRQVAKWVPYASALQPMMQALQAGGGVVREPSR